MADEPPLESFEIVVDRGTMFLHHMPCGATYPLCAEVNTIQSAIDLARTHPCFGGDDVE